MPTRPLASRLSLALAAVAAAWATSADADLDPGREIIRTGDRVPGLGRIGTLSAYPLAIDPTGRVLIAGYLDDGGRALTWSDGTHLETIWRHEEGGQNQGPSIGSTSASPDGTHLAAIGSRDLVVLTDISRQLFDLSNGEPRTVLSSGDRTSDGTAIVGFEYISAVSDSGAILVEAYVGSPASALEAPPQAVVLFDTSAHVVASTDPTAPAPIRFMYVGGVGITHDGAAIVSGCRAGDDTRCGIFRARDGAIEPILVEGDLGPDGTPIGEAYALDANADGEVLAYFYPPDNYDRRTVVRTSHGQLLTLRDDNAALPDGRTMLVLAGRLNARGDAILEGVAFRAAAPGATTLVLSYPAAGPPRLLPEQGSNGRLNDSGQIALRVAPHDEPARITRLEGNDSHTLLTARTAIDGDATLVAGGLAAMCLADDGRTANLALGTNGSSGWLCEDATGIHLVATTAQPSAGYPWNAQCAFAGGDQIVVLDGSHISRLGRAAGRVLGVGDRLADGSQVSEISTVSANAAGKLVAFVQAAGKRAVIRQERGGAVARVDLRLPGDVPPIDVAAAGIAADDTIVTLVYGDSGSVSLLATRDGDSRVLGEFDAGTYPTSLLVRGDYAAAAIVDSGTRIFRFQLSSGERDVIAEPQIAGDPFLVDLNAAGDVLFQTSDPLDLGSPRTSWRWHDGAVEELSRVASPFDTSSDPIALNVAGNVLQLAPGYLAGGRARLSLSGPAPSATCPGAAASSSSADNTGCQIGPGTTVTGWPLLLPLLGLGAARRRRAAGLEARATGSTS